MSYKIAVLPSWYPTNESPVSGIFVKEQAQLLARWFDVTLFVPRFLSVRKLFFSSKRLINQPETDGLLTVYQPIHHYWIPGWLPWWWGQFSFFLIARDFRVLLDKFGKPDLLHAHVVWPAGYWAVKLGKKYNIPVVLTEHSSPFSMHLGNETQRSLVRYTLQNADRIVAVSPALAAQIYEFIPNLDITVVGNLVQTHFFQLSTDAPVDVLDKHFTRFLVIALLSEQKGIIHLLEAASILLSQGYKQFEIVIGGDGEYRKILEGQASDLGVKHCCNFLGKLSRVQVREQMQQCDIFVLPSLHETFGIVLAEAMACGKPVISTRCGGPEYVVTSETGFLVESANSLELANAMAQFLDRQVFFNPDTIRQSVIDRFGEDAFLRAMSDIYRNL